ncbi:FAD binding domain-containing protein [Ophiobolus disseminans]|uniref:FAD binding domain-containing protein n=1 Tax=Ophiobolus disseminans TaxID=1469910 RepID=A0A6A6ZTQ7_9PLEO|nr:FAD binding domain-containing protein [Ophiobolus disseminans]
MFDCTSSERECLPVIIIGAGISGLLLAQELRKTNTPFRVFERDKDFLTRGAGWGLTLHWSLPALRELLPTDLHAQLRDTYVDRAAVERGETSTFPFFDLSTGERKGASPKLSEEARIRVTRERFRKLLATGIDIEWGKVFKESHDTSESVAAVFEDGSTHQGRLIVGCDGGHSRVRRALLHQRYNNHPIPVRLLGFTLAVKAEQAGPIRALDPFFLQGTASVSNVFMYISLLEAPQTPDCNSAYVYQVCISWNTTKPPCDIPARSNSASAQQERIAIIREVSKQWAEPFKTFVQLIPDTTNVQQLDISDFPPSAGVDAAGRVLLVGDACHAMSMYRGEGANHAIVDVLELKERVLPHLHRDKTLTAAVRKFEEGVIERTRPAVLASRKACLDAHDWHNLTPDSPLLTRRQMHLKFDG